jgi:hypothetical protein
MPASLSATDTSQTIIVVGSNFKPGLTVDITPSTGAKTIVTGGASHSTGGTIHLSGSAIQSVTDTSFEALVTVAAAGTYTLLVNNPAAPPSPAVTVTAQVNNAPRPAISGITPGSPVVSTTAQTVMVVGSDFQAGLSVALTGPKGTTTTLGGAAITDATQTTFHVSATLAEAGTYKLRVSNPGGQISEPCTFTVKAADQLATPTVTGVTPATPTGSGAPTSRAVPR